MIKNIINKTLVCFMIIGICSYVSFGSAILAFGPSNKEIYKGIDVSEWQGSIDFQKVKNDGIKIVYIRAGQGFNYEDSEFERNYTEAKKYGLKVGAYHYVTARNESDAKQQAKFFISLVARKNIDCKLAMDFEYFPDLTKQEINKIALSFLQEVEKLSGKQAIVYSDTYNASYTFNGEVAKYPLWIAQYGESRPQSNGNWPYWEGFQYTDSGRVSGIDGNVDRDEYTIDILLNDTSPIPHVDRPTNNTEDRIRHKVKRGDTLSHLAERYHTTVSHLACINNIENINLIYINDILIISSNRIRNAEGTYIIKWGDTLSELALKYNTTVQHLVEVNNIKDPDLIYAGNTLII